MSNQIATITSVIRTIRGKKVILDADLARIYGVSTKRLNEQVKRNADRFPPDFLLQLTNEESENLKSQFATSSLHGGRRKLPYAFTENGAIMAANVLNSPEAVRMSVFVVRAFVQMRDLLGSTKELAKQLAALEKKLTDRLDGHEAAIIEVFAARDGHSRSAAATARTAPARNRFSRRHGGTKKRKKKA
ncbi:MAG: ORF6N domain-containing protein [Limisphaerales bacterium]